jgi:hypothetical protein
VGLFCSHFFRKIVNKEAGEVSKVDVREIDGEDGRWIEVAHDYVH